MINANMRLYNYYTFGGNNAYGQATLSNEPTGTLKMAINLLSNSNTNNLLYSQATYIGLTNDAKVNDTYVIEDEEGKKLKVLYISKGGRYKQVFMSEYGN